MIKYSTKSIFSRSGLAALSDFESPEYQDVFSGLEREQNCFINEEARFRSKEYRWPRDPLHTWSRAWEYPYVYHCLASCAKKPQHSMPVVADVGSGVTFFPFSVAKLGYRVICTDIDAICKKDISAAVKCVDQSPGVVEFGLIEDNRIPIGDMECDAAYSISVLEHIPQFEESILEIYRILKPGGLFVLTCDINLQPHGKHQLDVANHAHLNSVLEKLFIHIWPERTIHPLNLLTSKVGPYPIYRRSSGPSRLWWPLIKQKMLKPLLGQIPTNARTHDTHLAVLCLAMRKRA